VQEKANRKRVQAVERALSLLQCFEGKQEELTLAVLAKRSGFYKSTILRLAASLEYKGFLLRNSNDRFALGPELARLGALSAVALDLEPRVRSSLRKLVAISEETASFWVRDGKERICLYRENSPHAARHHLEEGGRASLERGALSKIFRAYSPRSRDPRGPMIRQQGWAISEGEHDTNLAAVAVPLMNMRNEMIGALSVSGIRSRFTRERVELARRLLLKEGQSLSLQLLATTTINSFTTKRLKAD
jgi:DNA-binding IclR family transcriptional regulator